MDAEWGGTVRHIYGTTETMCSLYNPDPVGQHIRLRPGFYTRTRVIAIDGEPDDLVQPGEEGELIVRRHRRYDFQRCTSTGRMPPRRKCATAGTTPATCACGARTGTSI